MQRQLYQIPTIFRVLLEKAIAEINTLQYMLQICYCHAADVSVWNTHEFTDNISENFRKLKHSENIGL